MDWEKRKDSKNITGALVTLLLAVATVVKLLTINEIIYVC
jgi:hypothetical protein